MPRPKRPGGPEPKKRSRNGCWPCKARKVKCDEHRPSCVNCRRTGEACDYSIRLNWDGRRRRKSDFGSNVFQASLSYSPAAPGGRLAAVDADSASTASSASLERRSAQDVVGPAVVHSGHSGHLQAGAISPSSFGFTPGSYHPAGSRDTPLSSPDPAALAFTLPPFASEYTPEFTLPQTAVGFETSHGGLQWITSRKRLRAGDEAGSEGHRNGRISSPALTCDWSSAAPRSNPRSNLVSGEPLTPATPSTYSDDEFRAAAGRPDPQSLGVRRLSVNSLLAGPPGQSCPQEPFQLPVPAKATLWLDTRLPRRDNTVYYGIDRGFKDLDVGRNDDMNAITGSSPKLPCDPQDLVLNASSADDDSPGEFGFGVQTNALDYGPGGYYDNPVAICIPRSLEPLPARLRENPMNLLYFHHFLNHTARVLVPHDDPQSNPFRTVLPQMAVTNDNLLSLLLAYSASHRARLLQQPEPATRIAHWVQDLFPTLREALNDPTKIISKANIATAIMLASLEIISPTAFGYAIPWQKHLGLARALITSRPGVLRWSRTDSQEDQVCSFLWSWLAYLDVLGTLSGARAESSPVWVLEYEPDDHPGEADEVDCIMGFTTRCVYILARIAELARRCDAQRLGPDHRLVPGWRPGAATAAEARGLEAEVRASMASPPKPCKHIHNSGDVARWDRTEMAATNQAYHWAALVHLHRRVLGRPSAHADVRAAVRRIHACLELVRGGGTAEACLLFPMFTAGCDSAGAAERAAVLARVRRVEANGMMQVRRARRLMERVWETGQPWETLLSTEFIG